MAITLPRRGRDPGSRKVKARSASSGDVPVISSPADPGLRVPETGTEIAQGLESLSTGLSEAGDAAIRIIERDEGLARDGDDRRYSARLSEEMNNLQKAGDPSDPEAVRALGEKMKAEKDQLLAKHKGGDISRQLLQDRLERRHLQFTDSLAGMNISAANARMNDTLNRRLGAITQEVLTDPDVLLSDDPMKAFRRADAMLEDELDFMEANPAMARQARAVGRAEILKTMVTTLIQNGQTDRARALIQSPEAGEFLGSGAQRQAAQRIIEFEQNQKNSELAQLQEIAEWMAGPNATPEEVRLTARGLKGLKQQNRNLELFKPPGSKQAYVLDMDQDGKVVQIIGPSFEEQIENERRLAQARMNGKLEMLSRLAKDNGIPWLPTPTATGSTTGGRKAQPKRPAEGGQPAGEEGKRTGQDPFVTQVQDEEFGEGFVNPDRLIDPFEDGEPVSEDAAAVAALLQFARNARLVGENEIARGAFQEAQYISKNSEELRMSRELDKPLPMETLREFQKPVGSTYRDILGEVPEAAPSVRESARITALEAARAKAQVRGEGTLSFIQENQDRIDDLLVELEKDPKLVGIVGALRATGQRAFGALSDLGLGGLVEAAREMAETETELGLDDVARYFDDPNLSGLDILGNAIGLSLARIQTPEGQRVPVEVIKLSLRDSNLTQFSGGKRMANRLRQIKGFLDRREKSIRKRFNLGERDAEDEFDGGQNIPEGMPRYRFDKKTKTWQKVEED